MIERISRTQRINNFWKFIPGPEWDEVYRVTCDICGRYEDQKHLDYNYGFGALPFGFGNFYGGLICVPYGDYNRRSLFVCRTHKDSEIEAKINELK